MADKIAGIDVHKKVLMVVMLDAGTAEGKPERRRFATMPSELRRLSIWLREQGVEEVVMESTAQYWRSVWMELEPHMCLHLAQAHSNRAPRGRKHDFKDAERLVRRLIAKELILSFVPDGEQRIWRNLTRMKLQLVRDRVRLHSQIECLLEEMRIKLSVVVTDLLGSSGLRILHALAQGETDAKTLALLGDERLKCSEEQLIEALTGRTHPMHAQMLRLELERLRLLDEQIAKLNSLIAQAMMPHQEVVIRLAEVPGLGIDSAQQVIAEVGVTAATFSSAAEFTSWVGTCPGREESAEKRTPAVDRQKATNICAVCSTRPLMPQREAEAPTSRLCSGVCCHGLAINPPSGPSRIVSADSSGRFFMKAYATSSKAPRANPSYSSAVHSTWPNNFVSSATTSRSLLQTSLRYKLPLQIWRR
jgi:transposase